MKQEINCNVRTCKFNNKEKGMCQLQAILVSPVNGGKTKRADDSMCASYKIEE